MAAAFPSLEQLDELERHFYVEAFYCFGVGKEKKTYSQKAKLRILNELMQGLQANEYAVCRNSILLADLIKTVCEIKQNIALKRDTQEHKNLLKSLLNQCDDAFSDLYGLPDAFIHRVKGVRGAKKRYSQFLDKKYAIFKDILLKKTQKDGKFKNAKQAVEGVINDVELAFEMFDRQYATDKINEIKNKIKSEQEELKKFKKSKKMKFPEFAIKPASAEKRIIILNQKLEKWTNALDNHELYEKFPSIFLLKPEDFFDDILARHLRGDKAFCDQVIGS